MALDHLPPLFRDGRLVASDATRLTERQAVQAFVSKYRTFQDTEYLQHERNYKWDAHVEVQDELLSRRGRALVARGASETLTKLLSRLIHRTNLLAVQEFAALNDAFKDLEAAAAFARATISFVDAGGEPEFANLVAITGSLPAEAGRARVLRGPLLLCFRSWLGRTHSCS